MVSSCGGRVDCVFWRCGRAGGVTCPISRRPLNKVTVPRADRYRGKHINSNHEPRRRTVPYHPPGQQAPPKENKKKTKSQARRRDTTMTTRTTLATLATRRKRTRTSSTISPQEVPRKKMKRNGEEQENRRHTAYNIWKMASTSTPKTTPLRSRNSTVRYKRKLT